jgi:hypothetical protein
MTDTVTAYHEAAHAVVTYRAAGFSGGRITISPRPENGVLGSAEDGISDSFSAGDMESRVLSLYAGGHAQRRCDPSSGTNGCDQDDEMAAQLLDEWGWREREQELRQRALELVQRHWAEVIAVAEELLKVETLDDTEVEILADGAARDPERADVAGALARYRAFKR